MPAWVLFITKSGDATFKVALAGAVLLPPLVLVKLPAGTVLVNTPTCVAMTSARTKQLPLAGIVAPAIDKLDAVVVADAAQSLEAFAGLARTSPAGKLSVKDTAVKATALGLLKVKIIDTGSANEALFPADKLGIMALTRLGLASTGTVTELALLPWAGASSPPPATAAVLVKLAAALADTVTPIVMAG